MTANAFAKPAARTALLTLLLVGGAALANPPFNPPQNMAGGHAACDDNRPKAVAITLKTDPLEDPEAACVALQIGMNLLSDRLVVDGFILNAEPAAKVVLFPTLGGVELINPENDLAAIACDTIEGLGAGKLADLLDAFVDMGGEVISCPLCARSRGFFTPTVGRLGNARDIHDIFLYSDRVITF